MLIDWFTVIAQVINFLILVWLLKRYLYTPILKALDEREKRISTQLAEAEKFKEEAQKEKNDFKQKNENIDNQRKSLMKKNEEDANSERLKSFENLRNELQAQRLKMNELLNNERQELCNEIVHKTQHEVFEIVQKTLSDMASINVEAGIAEVFIQKILALSDDKIKLLQSALQASSFTAHIHSAFTISKEQGQGIKSAISSVTKKETSITFETDPSLVCGIELIADGYKLSWNITDYINSMEKNIT